MPHTPMCKHWQSSWAGIELHTCRVIELLSADRWQALEPGARAFAGAVTHPHDDMEAEVWRILVALNCAPFMHQYGQVCSSLHPTVSLHIAYQTSSNSEKHYVCSAVRPESGMGG